MVYRLKKYIVLQIPKLCQRNYITNLMVTTQNRNLPPPPIYNKIKRTETWLHEWSTNLQCCKRNNQTHKAKEMTYMWIRYVSFIIRLIWNIFTTKLTAIYGKRSLFFIETKFSLQSWPDVVTTFRLG